MKKFLLILFFLNNYIAWSSNDNSKLYGKKENLKIKNIKECNDILRSILKSYNKKFDNFEQMTNYKDELIENLDICIQYINLNFNAWIKDETTEEVYNAIKINNVFIFYKIFLCIQDYKVVFLKMYNAFCNNNNRATA